MLAADVYLGLPGNLEVRREMILEMEAMAAEYPEGMKAFGVRTLLEVLPQISERLDDWILELCTDIWGSIRNIGYMGILDIVVTNGADWHLLHWASHRLIEYADRVLQDKPC